MTLSIPGPFSARTPVRLAGLVMVLIGLFGMAGLASHASDGAPGADMLMGALASGPETTTAGPGSVTQYFADGTTAAAAAAVSTGRAVMTSAGSHADMGMNMACLCLAILMLGATGLLNLLNRFPRMIALWSAPRPLPSVRPSSREPDPPSLTALSVRRC